MIKLVGAARSHVGLKRGNNEDSFYCDNDLGLFLVADGMGGAASGELAGRLVIETVSNYISHYADKPLDAPERHSFYDRNLSDSANTLLQSVHLANELVYDLSEKNPRHRGMGSTVAALLADGDTVLVSNVGDSRVFRSRDDDLDRLTVDHRLSDDPNLRDVCDPESTMAGNLGNTLTRVMGVTRTVDPDLYQLPLAEGDMFLLCSDGLTDMVDDDMIAKILPMERALEQKAEDLVALALAGGGRDNVTVVVVQALLKKGLRGLLKRIRS